MFLSLDRNFDVVDLERWPLQPLTFKSFLGRAEGNVDVSLVSRKALQFP